LIVVALLNAFEHAIEEVAKFNHPSTEETLTATMDRLNAKLRLQSGEQEAEYDGMFHSPIPEALDLEFRTM
jgi:DNA-binding FadR family transcriptional regulator